jgi:acetyltransferase
MGLLNTDPQVSLNATFTTPLLPPAGNIGMLSQSGALGLAMLDYVQTLHVGLSTFVSVGNRADVSSNDLLAYWADDPRTSVIVLYLESFGNPRRFARIGARLDGILLQRQVSSGIEALVGVTTDSLFGPLLVCGLGGTLVEVLHDVTFRLTPVSDSEAAEMLAKLRANVLLDGYRGAPPGDREALIALLLRVSALVESVPELQEFDLNPVKVLPQVQGSLLWMGGCVSRRSADGYVT